MKYVIHKFVLTERVTTINLEADAVVLYADRDSRLESPAIWVRRRIFTGPSRDAKPGVPRTFRWVGTGEFFEAHESATMFGPVRLGGEFIFHVFEVES